MNYGHVFLKIMKKNRLMQYWHNLTTLKYYQQYVVLTLCRVNLKFSKDKSVSKIKNVEM